MGFATQTAIQGNELAKETICGFTEDFPAMTQKTSKFNKALYNHLRKSYRLDQELNTRFMALAEKQDDKSLAEMELMRKEMLQYEKQVKLFSDIREMHERAHECHGIVNEPEDDEEMKDIAKEELAEVEEQIEEFSEEIIDEILPKSDADSRNCTIEVMQAAGGNESSLFAGEVFEMYKQYCRLMGWRAQQTELQVDMQLNKGCKKGSLHVTGTDVYKHLKHESGVHKVQRVPETEVKGRLHSSTAVVLVMPEVPREFSINMKEVRLDFYRAQGAGGQHVNKTSSACRATHEPTGITAQCQDSREQPKNKESALATLRERLYKHFNDQAIAAEKEQRKDQIGKGDISEKIRTYNWPNNRITDHRTGEQKFGLESMFSGQLLVEFIEEAIELEREETLQAFLKGDS